VIEVRPARDESEVGAALALRHEVFCVEQGVSLEEELDGRDRDAAHLVVVDEDRAVVGTCRLLVEGSEVKLGRMAVARSRRRCCTSAPATSPTARCSSTPASST